MTPELQKALDAILGRRRRKRSPESYRAVKDGDLVNPVPLDEFLEGVGNVLRLPSRPLPPLPAEPAKTAVYRPRWWVMAVILVPLAGLALWPGTPAPEPSDAIPPLMAGTWTTSDPRYANRSMTITLGNLVFKTGDRRDDQTSHVIRQVRTAPLGDSTLVTMTYQEADGLFELAVKFVPRPRPTIIFVHQEEMTWHRANQDSK